MKVQELNAAMVLFHQGSILLLKRKDELWEFPSSRVEWGETPEQAAIREAKAGAGLTPDNVSLLTITSATYQKEQDEKHAIYLFYKGEARGRDFRLSQHLEGRWVMPHEAGYMKLALNSEPVLELLTRS